jgi:hypothetical protein
MSQILEAGRFGRDVEPYIDGLMRFGWRVGDGKWSDSGAERLAKRRKAAERRSQAPNGSAARMRQSQSPGRARALRSGTGVVAGGKGGRPEALERS